MRNTTKHSLAIVRHRDLMKEARVARGFYPVVVPIRSDKPTGRGKSDSTNVDNLSGTTGRGKGGTGSKSSGRSSNTRGRGNRGNGRGRSRARDSHRLHKSISSMVRLIIGRMIVRRWMMVLQSEEADSWSQRPTAILTIFVMKSVCMSRALLQIMLCCRDFSCPRR